LLAELLLHWPPVASKALVEPVKWRRRTRAGTSYVR
jgi:hypothetical protein